MRYGPMRYTHECSRRKPAGDESCPARLTGSESCVVLILICHCIIERNVAVNDPLGKDQLEALWSGVNRGRPLGEESSVCSTARRLGLEFTLRGPGRPRKKR